MVHYQVVTVGKKYMSKFINLLNQRYGKLIVIKELGRTKSGKAQWLCKCDCGNKKIISSASLRRGTTNSCGCLVIEKATKHNMARTSIYNCWCDMKSRCLNKNNKEYKNYGGRGIKVCDSWLKFENFYKDMGVKPNGLTIDRINNNGNYELSNCRWATKKEQGNNKRTNKRLFFNGKEYTLKQWCCFLKLNYYTIHSRFRLGWDVKKALTNNN